MVEFCEKFRLIESQIYEMAFSDRLGYFVDKLRPAEAAMHIRNADSIRSKDMEVVYQLARQWAANSRIVKPGNSHEGHRYGKPLVKFGKRTN